jgi:methylenetetrahydrofolate dehydrogenase (NADP+)/methenyltetrahydrofolate cyclohydrolase
MVLDGKEIADQVIEKLGERYAGKEEKPKLRIVSFGNDPASKIYMRNKLAAAKKAGIEAEQIQMNENENVAQIVINIYKMSQKVDGCIVQLPLPDKLRIHEDLIVGAIDPAANVDGFNDSKFFKACTPKGIIRLLDEYGIEIAGKNVVIIGRSKIVGKPLAKMMLERDATVTVCHSKTRGLENFTKAADIIVCAVGKRNLLTGDMVRDDKSQVIIDVGINRNEEGKICGDVDFAGVRDKVYAITPVPGGVGPLTVAMLMENTAESFEQFVR